MNGLFRRLPLPVKLMLIGFIPLIFLLYISIQFYQEKNKKLSLLENYIDRINESAKINTLIRNLQVERLHSFDYALRKAAGPDMIKQRPLTDSNISSLEKNHDPALAGFREYTFLKNLQNIRTRIDSGKISPGELMHYYTTMIFRINTLNAISPGSDVYLEPVYKDLVAQKLLSEMITNLGILRSNIYNALYAKKYMAETLLGMIGVHDVYVSYETEFLLKAAPGAIISYRKIRDSSSLKPTVEYIDTLFKHFTADSTYTAEDWWTISENGIGFLTNLQQNLWNNVNTGMSKILKNEQDDKRKSLIFIIIILILAMGMMAYTINVITSTLTELKLAAQKLSKGHTGLHHKIESNDAIGNLAHSISEIDENNQRLAYATRAIGNGDFDTPLFPRSDEDVLGNAIVTMKENLQHYIAKIKNAENEIAELNLGLEKKIIDRTSQLEKANNELEAFSYSVSHDLRAPLRGITNFTTILEEEYAGKLDDEAKRITGVIKKNTLKMGQLIDDLLSFSRMSRHDIMKTTINNNAIVKEIIDNLANSEQSASVDWNIHPLPAISADINSIHQVWVNLISNAVKYSKYKEKPCIEIGSFVQDGQQAFFVKDNGVGFDQQYSNKLFKVFQRLHSAKDFEGTGVGLAIVEKIISKHGGSVWVEGEKDKGATFYFSLPI